MEDSHGYLHHRQLLVLNPGTLTSLAFSNTLPTNMKVATPNGASTNCIGGTGNGGCGQQRSVLRQSGASLSSGGTCTVTVNVTSATASVYTNSTGAITATNAPSGPTASATLTVLAAPTTALAFGTTPIAYGGSTSLTITVTIPTSSSSLSGVSFTDSLPIGLVISTPNGLSGACGGSVVATQGTNSISLSGGSLAGGANCIIVVNVTGTSAGVKNDSLTSSATTAGAGNTATASVTVSAPVAVGFTITGLGPFTAPGAAGTATVTAVDALGGTITTYAGTVKFTSNDAGCDVLPANWHTYVAGDNGVHTFPVTLNTAGTFSVTVTDTVSSITGSG